MHGVVAIAADLTPIVGPARVVSWDRAIDELDATPDAIVVVDLDDVPVDRIRVLRSASPMRRVIVLSSRTSGAVVLSALRAGVAAVVRKPDDLADLGGVLARVAGGDMVISGSLRRVAIEELGRLVRGVRSGREDATGLTDRELQILGLLAEGLTTRQIGTRLSISPRTVEGHASGVYRKLAVRTRVQAVARAAALGLVEVR